MKYKIDAKAWYLFKIKQTWSESINKEKIDVKKNKKQLIRIYVEAIK